MIQSLYRNLWIQSIFEPGNTIRNSWTAFSSNLPCKQPTFHCSLIAGELGLRSQIAELPKLLLENSVDQINIR